MAAIAVRVFGNPITHGTRTQRALAAKNNENADGKLDQVLQVLNQSQKLAGAGGGNTAATDSTTFGHLYNATGETLTYVTAYDWEGNASEKYPVNIQNGQWAIFMHVGTHHQGSVAAVVYNFVDCWDSMISWNNPWKNCEKKNTTYCEMNNHGCDWDWDAIHEKLVNSGNYSQSSMGNYSTKVTIEAEGNTPTFTAKFY
ncbi:hypothetical protein L6452_31557 [Arctium lappa]|uniref:Uncharacterized protein n=1 Tax=Arctium lappa TaxID=4217 RepID=A0ACB8Z392_ARCLA|nr:hypothetical protein L6452_31557 [Arctium lappa]